MLISARNSKAASNSVTTSDEQAALLQMEDQLPPVLSVIAGMVDLTGFFMLGVGGPAILEGVGEK